MSNQKIKIYLCGAINGCTDDEANSWRDEARILLENKFYECVDPMDRDYRGVEGDVYREIVDLDKIDVKNSDVILVMYNKPSVGTSMEVFYAWNLVKPVVVVDKTEKPLSPWLVYHSTKIVKSLRDAVDWIKQSVR